MALFRLIQKDGDIGQAEIHRVEEKNIGREEVIEQWIENHPESLDLKIPLLIIGRQESARIEGLRTIYPDLIATDQSGNLYILELKKVRMPREIVALT